MLARLTFRRLSPIPILALLLAVAGCATPPGSGLPKRHAIAAAHPLAAEAGLEMLRAGGSAVDATIAAQIVLTLVEPQSSGIGGGAFLIHYAASNDTVDAYDGRETAPAGARPGMFLNAGGQPKGFRDVVAGGQSVGVPGTLRMLELAHRDHGKLPWARLFEPAIRLADNGFPMSPRLVRMLTRSWFLRDDPAAFAHFYQPDGHPKPAGTMLRNPALAKTLRRIATEGADALYTGEIAAHIVAAVRQARRNPGTMTARDLANYRPVKRKPVCRPYRVWTVCGMPPPTSGGITTLQILGLLERFEMSAVAPGSLTAVHLISEASRLAYADRDVYIADPAFVQVPVDGLLDPGYLKARSDAISGAVSMGKAPAGTPWRTSGQRYAPGEALELPSTSHLSAIDDKGNAVSMTTSIESVFGSRMMVDGFMLNNEMTDFSFRPEVNGRPVANRVEPGKRPRSSMAPVLVFDQEGRLYATLGSPGGPRIITYVAKALIALLDWKMTMPEAFALPNHANLNGPTILERGTALSELAPSLIAMGHTIRYGRLGSGLHGIRVTPGGLEGAADPRREGVALGD